MIQKKINICRQNKKEGVAILWKADLDGYITPVNSFEFDLMIGIKICNLARLFYLINVYLQYECADKEVEFVDRMCKLNVILDELDSNCVSVVDLGDVIRNCSSEFSEHLSEFCSISNYTWSSKQCLSPDRYK